MSVQRFDSYGYMPSPEGKNMRYDDHARIVAERVAEVTDALMASKREALAEMEQAHAAALDDKYAKGYKAAAQKAVAVMEAAAPRILTADDPEPAVTSVGLDRDQSVWQRVGSTEHSRWVNPFMGTREWSDVLARGPVRLLHDGEATPQVKPCSTCGEPVAYLTARPGWAGGWLHHPARPLDGHPAAIDGEATT